MFFINENEIKEHTVVDYLKSEKFTKNIKPKFLSLFKQSKDIDFDVKNLFETIKISDDFSKLQNQFLNKKELNKYSSYLGKWSEFFLETCTEYYEKHENIDFDKEIWDENNHIIIASIEKTKKYFKNKIKNQIFNYFEIGENISTKNNNVDFLIKENSLYFLHVVNHFKKIVPYFKNFVNWNKFTSLYSPTVNSKYKNECEITGWEFDFYDPKNKFIIDLKFQNKVWSIDWVWQLLMYAYLMHFYYDIKVEGIMIINTYSGIIWKNKLENLFVKEGFNKFLEICKTEISDYEKTILTNRILSCFKEQYKNSNISIKTIISNIFFTEIENEIENYACFLKQIQNYQSDNDFYSNIHNEKWIWEQWIRFQKK